MGYFASQFRRKTESQVKSNLGEGKHCSLNTQDAANRSLTRVPHCHVNDSKQNVQGKENEDYLSRLKLGQ